MAKKMHLNIILPKGKFYDDSIDYILLRSTNGDIAFMPGHIPITCLLTEGIAKIVKDKKEHNISIMRGVVEVSNDVITILTSTAEWPGDIDVERAKNSKVRADKRLKDLDNIDKDRAMRSIRRAEIRIKLSLYKNK